MRPALRRHASLQYLSSPSGSTLLQVRHREILDMDVMSSSTIAITKSHYERGKGAPLLDLGATTTAATG